MIITRSCRSKWEHSLEASPVLIHLVRLGSIRTGRSKNSFSKTKYERTYLPLHVHDDHRIRSVTHHELFHISGDKVDAMYGDVRTRGSAQRLERILALRGLQIPHLHRSVRTGAESNLLDVFQSPNKFFERLYETHQLNRKIAKVERN